jgi:hypothetical protein
LSFCFQAGIGKGGRQSRMSLLPSLIRNKGTSGGSPISASVEEGQVVSRSRFLLSPKMECLGHSQDQGVRSNLSGPTPMRPPGKSVCLKGAP